MHKKEVRRFSEELNRFMQRVISYGRMIRFSHTVFVLPFALSAVVLAQRHYPLHGSDFLWILLAMVCARSAAMGFNRIVDARFDALNPRTAKREIPSGKLTMSAAKIFVTVFSLAFLAASAMLGRLCLYLSLPVLVVLFSYSYAKRFTWLCHVYLGFALGLAPVGAWIALAKGFSWNILLLSIALMTYIAGFDILYACQDYDFDRRCGLYSIPAAFGLRRALFIASGLHMVSFCFFFWIYFVFDMNAVYLAAVGLIGALMILEHRLVSPDDLSRVKMAFFHVNSVISIMVLAGVLGDELFRRWMG